MSRLQFAANVSTAFKECASFKEKLLAAKRWGFRAVEITGPYDEDPNSMADALKATEMKCVLINSYPGPGSLGLSVDPEKKKEFQEKLEVSIDYAKKLQCPKIHIIGGLVNDRSSTALQRARETYCYNIALAADRLAKENMSVLIEAVNTHVTAPNYFLDHPALALDIIKQVNKSNVEFQMDIFHLQMITGNLTNTIQTYLPKTGYIQISQAPHRHEPGSPGEIDYKYVLDFLQQKGYQGWIGLEYFPEGKTEDGRKYLETAGILPIAT